MTEVVARNGGEGKKQKWNKEVAISTNPRKVLGSCSVVLPPLGKCVVNKKRCRSHAKAKRVCNNEKKGEKKLQLPSEKGAKYP